MVLQKDELLCFIVNKRGRLNEIFLETIVYNFYVMEDSSLAKTKLLDAVDTLILDKCLCPSKLRDIHELGVKHKKYIDDILGILAFLDDQDLLDCIPHFVSSDTDLIPSANWSEGDIAGGMNKLASLEEQISMIVTKLGDKFIVGQNEQAELLREVIATKNISTELSYKCSKSGFTGPISLGPTVFPHSRVGALTAIGHGAGRSGTSTDDSDDGARPPAPGARGSQPKRKKACRSIGAKDIIPNDDNFSIVISKRQKITLSDLMKPSHPGNGLPSHLYGSVFAAGSSTAPV